MNRISDIAKAFRASQVFSDIINVKLVNDILNKWEITFKYPNDKCVIIHFEFHLVEPLPPKATVLFPTNIKYVCFAELGNTKWSKDNDIPTLLLCLHNEYQRHAERFLCNTQYMTQEKAQSNWEYMRSMHTDWEIQDVSKLMNELPTENMEQLQCEIKEVLMDILPPKNLEHANDKEKVINDEKEKIILTEPILSA